MSEHPQVAVVIRPFHELGLTLCRLLAMEGTRIVVLDRDPSLGEAFCHRMSLEGFNASYRFIDPELPTGERSLSKDLRDVYGRIQTLITFFEPVAPEGRLDWLGLPESTAASLIGRAFDWRMRLLREILPLFHEQGGVLMNVLMGVSGDESCNPRADALVAGMINDMLSSQLAEQGIQVRQVCTESVGFNVERAREEAERFQDEVARVMDTVVDARAQH